MLAGLYAKWMVAWETALTTRDENRVERPLEWGFEHLAEFGGAGGVAGTPAGLSAPAAKNAASGRDDNFGDASAKNAASGRDDRFGDASAKNAASGRDDRVGDASAKNAASDRDDRVGDASAKNAASDRDDRVGDASAKNAASDRDDRVGDGSELGRMIALNERIVAEPHAFFDYGTPVDFRIERHFPELYPTNVRPETLEQEREWKRQAEVGELRKVPFLRFTSALRTPYPENDVVNARWYEAKAGIREQGFGSREGEGKSKSERPKQAMIVMPQWNADAFSHNALCELFNRFGISCLRLSKPYHDVRRPAELERSDYAVSANVGRTIAACRQAVVDIRSCMDWLEMQGYEQFGVLGTSLGSAYAFIAAAMDARLRVCAFNHASTQFGDVVWTGQSTRHVKAAFEHAGLTQDQVRAMFAGVSPMSYMEQFAATGRARWDGDPARTSLVVYAPYDLTFIERYSVEVLRQFEAHGVEYGAKVLPCGHYTTGETPYKYLDGWYLGSFIWRAFRALRGPARTAGSGGSGAQHESGAGKRANTGVSPLRRQSAPPPVEMTMVEAAKCADGGRGDEGWGGGKVRRLRSR